MKSIEEFRNDLKNYINLSFSLYPEFRFLIKEKSDLLNKKIISSYNVANIPSQPTNKIVAFFLNSKCLYKPKESIEITDDKIKLNKINTKITYILSGFIASELIISNIDYQVLLINILTKETIENFINMTDLIVVNYKPLYPFIVYRKLHKGKKKGHLTVFIANKLKEKYKIKLLPVISKDKYKNDLEKYLSYLKIFSTKLSPIYISLIPISDEIEIEYLYNIYQFFMNEMKLILNIF